MWTCLMTFTSMVASIRDTTSKRVTMFTPATEICTTGMMSAIIWDLWGRHWHSSGSDVFPISVLMISLCILFGASGILMLGVLDFAPAKAYLGAAVVALTGTGLLSELLASLIPKEESYYCLPEALVGSRRSAVHGR